MKPFLLLATRDHDEAAAAEYASVRRHTGLEEADLKWLRVESQPLPDLDLDEYNNQGLEPADVKARVDALSRSNP